MLKNSEKAGKVCLNERTKEICKLKFIRLANAVMFVASILKQIFS